MLARSRRLFLQSQVTLISDVARSKKQVETLHKASMDMNMSIFFKGKVKNNQDQGCISCGILVSGIGARGVSSQHMENMEMFSCSPT